MNFGLIDVAKAKGANERIQPYWNTFHCQNSLVSSNGKLYSNYCKNRFCTICCAIRKADIINKYYPTICKWRNPHFVTLAVKACKAKNLKKWVNGMFRAFELIHNRCKKRHQRRKSIKLIGIKSLECNFNAEKRTYNPHFHLIVASKEIAEWLIQWKSDKTLFAYKGAQDIRPIEDLKRDLIETIKYGSKIFTEPDLKNKGNKSIPPMIHANALDNILTALKGKRIFDRFGFNLPKPSKLSVSSKMVRDFDVWTFMPEVSDWVNENETKRLTGYIKSPELGFLLNECIDLQRH